jgi:hypothetical protein
MEINFCPRWLPAKLGLPPDKQIHFALLFSSLMAMAMVPVLVRVPHVCLVQVLLGGPCPGCGVLHSISAFARLDVQGAWQSNPAGIALAALMAFQIVARPVAMLRTRRTGAWVSAASRVGSSLALATLFLSWSFRLLQGRI